MAATFGTETIFEYKEKLELDKKDKKILYELYLNARVPVSKISKKVGLSKDTVKYRIKRMEKKGLILGHTAVVNLNKLEYHWNILLIQTNFENQSQETSFIEFTQECKNILKVMKCSGKWDYQIDVVYSSILEFNKIINKIKYFSPLLDFAVLNCLKEIKYAHIPEEFFEGITRKNLKPPVGRVDESQNKTECDEIDLTIIKNLLRNSRITLLELSRLIKLSPDATNNRIKRLETIKILNGFMPVINTAMLYDEHWIFMQLNKENKLISFLEEHKSIQTIYETGYQYDLFFWISTKTIGEYEQILTEIKNKFSKEIIKIDSVIALKEYKYTEFPGIEVESV